MARVLALVEGPTERAFGQQVLATHLGALGIDFRPRVVGKPGQKGGVREWTRTKKELVALIRQERRITVTTMFDLYALPACWPGRQEAERRGLVKRAAAEFIESRIAADVASELATTGPEPRFIPYLSLHEYEALLFSDPDELAKVAEAPSAGRHFRNILEECGGCEEIDEGHQTAPSKRILQLAPTYRKVVDGLLVASRIGLTTIRACCPHFDAWLSKLEAAE